MSRGIAIGPGKRYGLAPGLGGLQREVGVDRVSILHRTERLAAAFKPSGMLVHNSAWAGPPEPTMTEQVRLLLDCEAHPLGRLDRGTSGVVWFSLDRTAYAEQHAALAHPDATKRYGALVRGHLRAPLLLDHPVPDGEGGRLEARSRIAPLWHSSSERACFVELLLETGRRHQARLHLKHLSHPVIGDANYGKGALNRHFAERYGLRRLALHCFEVAFTDPATGERLAASAPLPPDLEQPLALLR